MFFFITCSPHRPHGRRFLQTHPIRPSLLLATSLDLFLTILLVVRRFVPFGLSSRSRREVAPCRSLSSTSNAENEHIACFPNSPVTFSTDPSLTAVFWHSRGWTRDAESTSSPALGDCKSSVVRSSPIGIFTGELLPDPDFPVGKLVTGTDAHFRSFANPVSLLSPRRSVFCCR
uniref:Uncharacterized protein n=1 Tax=Toxoplasma gondii COUG TaxID=1074873 RepID=A0A2G8XRL9_TOXGO|nr:hypothetical protein TGCOUG_293256 [Toxoplasma gondii COUG]